MNPTRSLAASAMRRRAAVVTIVLGALATSGAALSTNRQAVDTGGTVAAYAELMSTYADFPAFLDSASPFRFKANAARLADEFERIRCDVSLRLGFSTELVRLDAMSQEQTVRWQEASRQKANWLVIAGPFEGSIRATLVVLSSSSPRRTSILLVRPDLSVKLVYDTLTTGPQGPALGMVVGFRSKGDAVTVTEEGHGVAPRQFSVDVRAGVVSELASGR